MTTEQFTFWLQGYAEIHGGTPTPEQWQIIMDHLKEVFKKVTPNRSLLDQITDAKPVPMPSIAGGTTPWPNQIQPVPMPFQNPQKLPNYPFDNQSPIIC